MTFTVALPDQGMLHRLSPADPGVEFIVWTTDDTPPGRRVDLLVLPYSVSSAALPRLAAADIAVVQSQALGFDGVAGALPPGITYCNAVGVHEGPTGELAVGLILESQRGLDVAARAQPVGSWHRDWHPGLLGASVLVIGVGGVGAAIAARLAPFEVELTRVARSARADARGEVHALQELPRLLPSADVVILALPLTAETRGMVDDRFLGRLKHGALLVNVSRGAIVETDALTAAVATGAVRAALDVVEPEPLPSDHPLWSLPGVIITPHLGGNVSSMPSRVDPLVREQISRLRRGLPPLNIVVEQRT
jgi:phosphoglycerate dehydrogenase-like enzyme